MADSTGSSDSELAVQLANLLKTNISQIQPPKLSDNLQINIKLNSQNYALWTRMIRVAIGGRSKALVSHLTSQPPEKTSDEYETWEQKDLVVFSWLIQNIEPTLAGNLTEYPTAKELWDALATTYSSGKDTGNLTEYPTAKELWDALATTYSSGKDKLQTFNLHVKANELKQNEKSLEDFWVTLQGVWGEIDRIDPNPMTCSKDIKTYTQIRSEQKLFQFLNGLDRKYESIKREILRLESLPTVEVAYATIRKEAAHQMILGATNDSGGIATGLTAGETEGSGLAAAGFRRYDRKKPPFKEDKSHLTCDECHMTGHTKHKCFRVLGYPDWWVGNKRNNPKSSPTAHTSTTDENNHRKSGFGGLAAAGESGEAAARKKEEGEEFHAAAGYQDGSDNWVWH